MKMPENLERKPRCGAENGILAAGALCGKIIDGLRNSVRRRAALAMSAVLAVLSAAAVAQAAPKHPSAAVSAKKPSKKLPTADNSVFFVRDARKDPKGIKIMGDKIGPDLLPPSDRCMRCVVEVRCREAIVTGDRTGSARSLEDIGNQVVIGVPMARGATFSIQCEGDEGAARKLTIPPYVDPVDELPPLELFLGEEKKDAPPDTSKAATPAPNPEPVAAAVTAAIPSLSSSSPEAPQKNQNSHPWHVGLTERVALAESGGAPLLTASGRASYGVRFGRNFGKDGNIAVEVDVLARPLEQQVGGSQDGRFSPVGLRTIDGRAVSAAIGAAYRKVVARADNSAELRARGGVRAGAAMLDFPARQNAAVDGDGNLADLPSYRHVVPTVSACAGVEAGADFSRIGVALNVCGSSTVSPVQTTAGGPTKRLMDAHAEMDFKVRF